MVSQTTLTLLQFVALALPAIGIYMQIIHSAELERANRSDLRNSVNIDLEHDYQLTRLSFVLMATAGVILVFGVLLEIWIAHSLLHDLVVSATLIVSALALASLFFSGLIQQDALSSDVTISRAIGSIADHFRDLIN